MTKLILKESDNFTDGVSLLVKKLIKFILRTKISRTDFLYVFKEFSDNIDS